MNHRLAQRRQILGALADAFDDETFFAVMTGIQTGISACEIEEVTETEPKLTHVSELIILRWKEKLLYEGYVPPTKAQTSEGKKAWAKEMMRKGPPELR
jgi:hypothetical protein